MLPVLVVLFLISYGLMSMLVVEQGRTIDQQRTLIGQLFGDSVELSSMKGKELQRKRAAAQAQAKNPAKTPSSQGTPQEQSKSSHGAGKIGKPALEKPPKAVETGDERRALVSI